MSEPLLRVEGRKVHFPIRRGVFFDRTVGHVRAVDGVDLAVDRGTTYGLVGESGCGKSTLGRAVLRLVEPTAGQVLFDGTDVASLKGEPLRKMRRRMQMVFQDPMGSLDPRQDVESLLTEPLQAHGLGGGKKDLEKRVGELLDAVGLPAAARRRYPHEFSGGQRQRIGIARALALSPRLIVCDEPVSALDVSIQAQILNLLRGLQDDFNLTYLFISHDLGVVRYVSDRIAVLYLGRIVEIGSAADLYDQPRMPYTAALLSAVPKGHEGNGKVVRERIVLKGDVPSPVDPPPGCVFHPRCPQARLVSGREDEVPENCRTEMPPLGEVDPGRLAACWYPVQPGQPLEQSAKA